MTRASGICAQKKDYLLRCKFEKSLFSEIKMQMEFLSSLWRNETCQCVYFIICVISKFLNWKQFFFIRFNENIFIQIFKWNEAGTVYYYYIHLSCPLAGSKTLTKNPRDLEALKIGNIASAMSRVARNLRIRRTEYTYSYIYCLVSKFLISLASFISSQLG